jgi:hypothetical protein
MTCSLTLMLRTLRLKMMPPSPPSIILSHMPSCLLPLPPSSYLNPLSPLLTCAATPYNSLYVRHDALATSSLLPRLDLQLLIGFVHATLGHPHTCLHSKHHHHSLCQITHTLHPTLLQTRPPSYSSYLVFIVLLRNFVITRSMLRPLHLRQNMRMPRSIVS